MIRHLLTGTCLAVTVLMSSAAIATSFIPLSDDDDSALFTAEVQCRPELPCQISRLNADGPYYDGPPGYTVVKVRARSRPQRRLPELSVLVYPS